MSDKLDWTECGKFAPEYHAHYRGFRIRAVHDDIPENPIETEDGHWPMMAHFGRTEADYDKRLPGVHITNPLDRFNDAQLVHDQKAIGKALECNLGDVRYFMPDRPYGLDVDNLEADAPKWITDAQVLRDWFTEAWDGLSRSEQWKACEGLYQILGIPCLRTTSTGYSQGDWADLLIVATPEAQEAIRSKPEGMCDEDWAKVLAEDMEGQAKLYGYWAWGDVYGYVVEKLERPATCFECDATLSVDAGDECLHCGAEIENEWIDACDHNSCWGFYGDDFAESGLEEQAKAVIDSLLDNPTIEQEAA